MGKNLQYTEYYKLILEFYNLHLTCGYSRDKEKNNGYPSKEERENLIKFFEKNEKNITRFQRAGEFYKELGAEFVNLLLDDNAFERSPFDAKYEIKGSLGEYEFRKIKILKVSEIELSKHPISQDWLEQQNFTWFESEDLLEFTKEYHNIKSLIDSYIVGKIPVALIEWLNRKIGEYNRELSLTRLDFGMPIPIDGLEPSEKYIDMGQYAFTLDRLFDRKEPLYGIRLKSLMYRIHLGLSLMLTENPEIKYCCYEPGKRNPFCNNIFIPKKENQKFCSDKSRLAYHNSKKAGYMREKRNPNSPLFDRKYCRKKG